MPQLLSVQMMGDAQRAMAQTSMAVHMARNSFGVPAEEIPWRVTLWFRKDGRPHEGNDWVLLTAKRPREVLLTTVIPPDLPDAARGLGLVRAALEALAQDCIDCKAPVLVLCDWL